MQHLFVDDRARRKVGAGIDRKIRGSEVLEWAIWRGHGRVRVGGTVAKQHKHQVTAEQTRGGEEDAVEYGSHVGRRLTNDAQDLGRGRLPSQRLISLAGQPRDLCIFTGSGGTASAHSLL